MINAGCRTFFYDGSDSHEKMGIMTHSLHSFLFLQNPPPIPKSEGRTCTVNICKQLANRGHGSWEMIEQPVGFYNLIRKEEDQVVR
jgi:hypothetical protein